MVFSLSKKCPKIAKIGQKIPDFGGGASSPKLGRKISSEKTYQKFRLFFAQKKRKKIFYAKWAKKTRFSG